MHFICHWPLHDDKQHCTLGFASSSLLEDEESKRLTLGQNPLSYLESMTSEAQQLLDKQNEKKTISSETIESTLESVDEEAEILKKTRKKKFPNRAKSIYGYSA